MSEYATMDTDEDMTYPDTRTHDQKVVAQLAALELALERVKQHADALTYDLMATNTRVSNLESENDTLRLENHKLSERVAHNEVWLHKLLNPNADADPSQQPTLLDLQDGF